MAKQEQDQVVKLELQQFGRDLRFLAQADATGDDLSQVLASESVRAFRTMLQDEVRSKMRGRDLYFADELPEETRRSALPEEKQVLTASDFAVLFKRSKFEIDAEKLALGKDELFAHYESVGVDAERVFASHLAQQETLQRLKAVLPETNFINLYESTAAEKEALAKRTSALLVVGGDDSFKAANAFFATVSDRNKAQRPFADHFIIGLNSDPQHSVGALMSCNAESFVKALPKLAAGTFEVEEWPRLKVSVNGEPLGYAVSEVAVIPLYSRYAARGVISGEGEQYALKGSGILVATGVGSTGWFQSAAEEFYGHRIRWAKTREYAEVAQREAYAGAETPPLSVRSLIPGKQLTYSNTANQPQEVTLDSVTNLELPRGAQVTIELADSKLRMLRFS